MSGASHDSGRWTDQGGSVLDGLLRMEPEEVARWILVEARYLRHQGVDVERTNLYLIAKTFGERPPEEQKRLIGKAVGGFVQTPDGVRQEVAALASELVKCALSAVRHEHTGPTLSPRDDGNLPPLLQNCLKVAEGAGFYNLSVPEQQALIQEGVKAAASKGSGHKPPMRELLELTCQVHGTLTKKERKQLGETVAAPRLLGEGGLWIVERTLEPGGYAEMGRKLLDVELQARTRWWAYLLVPFLQISLCFALPACKEVPLRYWLAADAGLWLAAFITGFFAYRWGCPACRDLICAVAGVPGAAPSDGNLLGPLWPVIAMAIFCLVFLLSGSLAAFLATVYLVVAVFEDCSMITVGVCGIFIFVRHCTTSVLAFHTAWLVQEICFVLRKLTNPHLGDSPKSGYGSVEAAA